MYSLARRVLEKFKHDRTGYMTILNEEYAEQEPAGRVQTKRRNQVLVSD